MITYRKIIILPAPNCRRSRKVIEYLETHHIPFTQVPLGSPQGRTLAEQHHLRASPGILVDGISINPFDLLLQPVCQVDDAVAQRVFGAKEERDEDF
jgi:hypothetical protein